jgi:hypothetical protein
MRELTIYYDENGVMKPIYASTNGKWTCLCCGNALSTEVLTNLLKKYSAKDDVAADIREMV